VNPASISVTLGFSSIPLPPAFYRNGQHPNSRCPKVTFPSAHSKVLKPTAEQMDQRVSEHPTGPRSEYNSVYLCPFTLMPHSLGCMKANKIS